LTVHQTLSKGAFRYVEHSASDDQTKVVAQLVKILSMFYWVQGGDAIDAASMQTTDEDRTVVGLCMFPGMMRNVKEDEGQLTFNVVKAMAKSAMR
jgi:hypothetical protein